MTMQTDKSSDKIVLRAPNSLRVYAMPSLIGNQKAAITRYLHLYWPLIVGKDYCFESPGEWMMKPLQKLLEGKYINGYNAANEIFYALFDDDCNLKRAVDAWPAAIRIAVEEAVRNYFISPSFLRETAAANPTKIAIPDGRNLKITGKILESFFSNSESMSCQALSIGRLLHRRLANILEIEEFSERSSTTDVLPEGDYTVINYELSTVGAIDSFDAVCDINGMRLQSSYIHPMKESDLTTVASACEWEEPFATSPFKAMKNFRTRMATFWLLNVYERDYRLRRPEQFPNRTEAVIKSMREFFQYPSVDIARLAVCSVPFIGRFGKKQFGDLSGNIIVSQVKSSLLKYSAKELGDGASDPWVDLTELVNEILAKVDYESRLCIDVDMVENSGLRNEYSNQSILLTNALREFSRPFIRGIIVSLGMLGLVELVKGPDNKGSSPFDCFRFVRLTRLGRHVFGRDAEYVVNVEERPRESVNPIELYDDSLMILAQRADSADYVRANIGRKVSSTRFVADERSIMRGVTFPYELKNKRNTLLQLSRRTKLPKIWEDMFDSLNRKFSAISPVNISKWNMYTVDSSASDIVSLLSDDPDIRALISLVEGGRFLVAAGDDDVKLRMLLAAHGVTLPSPYRRLGYY